MAAHEFDYIKKEVKEISRQVHGISPDNAFIVWFLRAFFTDDQEQALSALTGGANDKGVDAIHIDQEARTAFVIQGKYRQGATPPNENRSDLMALADYAHILPGPLDQFKTLLHNADPSVQGYLERARHAVVHSGFRVGLVFATTGKVSKAHARELENEVSRQENATLQVFDRASLLRLLDDYVEGAAPPVPSLRLRILDNARLMRHDKTTNVTSYIFAMPGNDVGNLYRLARDRLFARNIRGFLGVRKDRKVNEGIHRTLSHNPEYFWYFNNGVTIICDAVDPDLANGQEYFVVTNPQIINGQQTTRALADGGSGSTSAAVLVKLIAVNRDTLEGREKYGRLVGEIVAATNFQNEIRLSALKANDAEQVRLERELRKHGVLYVRKRQSKAEVRRIHGVKHKIVIKKEELARAVAGGILDPQTLRLGKENLFDDANYPKIFSGRPILEYLTLYWLDKAVRWRVATSEQGYSRWLVLNFMWDQIGEKLKWPAFASWFASSMRQYQSHVNELHPLLSSIDAVLYSAMEFYRKNRRGESGVLDASSFFRHAKLHVKFKTHWDGRSNVQRRRRFESRLERFVEGARPHL
jgi:hypothetical protein